MTQTRRGRGCRFDSPHRKKLYAPIHKLLTPRADVQLNVTASVDQYRTFPILDQGQTSTCEGHRAAMAVHIGMAAMGQTLGFFPSPRGIIVDAYCMSQPGPDGPLVDQGCMTSDVQMALAACGVEPFSGPTPDGRNSDCTPENVTQRPSLTDLATQAQKPISGLYYIDTAPASTPLAHIQSALQNGYVVGLDIFCDTLFEEWEPENGPLDDCNTQDPSGGGHAILCTQMLTTATGETALRGLNSWGLNWGDQGYWEADANWFAKAVDGIVVFEMNKLVQH